MKILNKEVDERNIKDISEININYYNGNIGVIPNKMNLKYYYFDIFYKDGTNDRIKSPSFLAHNNIKSVLNKLEEDLNKLKIFIS